jgi:hypothetical protein
MGLNSGFSYEKASSEDGETLLGHDEHDAIPRNITLSRGFKVISRSPKLVFAMAMPFLTLTLLVIFGGVLLARTWKPTLSQITISTRIPPDFCGSTPDEARAAGCMFEANNFAWQHPACYDADMEEEWRNGPWSGDRK